MLQGFRNAPPGRQLVFVIVGAALLCALLAAIYFSFLRTSYGVLFSNLRSADAATIVAELDKQKIPYRLDQGGTVILVPAERVDSTRLAVMGEDLPLKGQVGFELFNKSDMGLTDFAQKINYQRALQGELARTIMTMDAIESARVHLSLSEHTIFRDDHVAPKASISLVLRAGHRITQPVVRGIQRLVAAAVPELEPGNVVVVNESGEIVSSDLVAETPTEGSQDQSVIQYYERQVRKAIEGLAPANTDVSVWSEPAPWRGRAEGAAASATRPAALGDRDFALHVSISVPGPLTYEAGKKLKAASQAAIGGGPASGDIILVSSSSSSESGSGNGWESGAASPERPRAAVAAGAAGGREFPDIALWAGLAAALLVLVAMILARRRGQRTLTEQERADYVSRFKKLLGSEQANV